MVLAEAFREHRQKKKERERKEEAKREKERERLRQQRIANWRAEGFAKGRAQGFIEGVTKGRADQNLIWYEWLARKLLAESQGLPFTEPPPSLEDALNESSA